MNSRGADVLVDGGCHHQEITRQVYPSCLRLQPLLHLHQHFDLSVDKFLGMIHFRYVFRPHISYTYFSSVNDVLLEQSGIEPDLVTPWVVIYFYDFYVYVTISWTANSSAKSPSPSRTP